MKFDVPTRMATIIRANPNAAPAMEASENGWDVRRVNRDLLLLLAIIYYATGFFVWLPYYEVLPGESPGNPRFHETFKGLRPLVGSKGCIMRSTKLTKLLDTLDETIEGQKSVSLADIVEALEKRGFGALLLVPALITVLPTGAIPGVPAGCAVVICLVAGQLVIGLKKPWLPSPLGKVSISRKKLSNAIEKTKPYAEAMDEFATPRYEFLTKDISQRVIAVLCMALAVIMAMIGFVPFVPALFSLPVLLFAAGICLRDGLLTLFGFAFCIVAAVLFPFLLAFLK